MSPSNGTAVPMTVQGYVPAVIRIDELYQNLSRLVLIDYQLRLSTGFEGEVALGVAVAYA